MSRVKLFCRGLTTTVSLHSPASAAAYASYRGTLPLAKREGLYLCRAVRRGHLIVYEQISSPICLPFENKDGLMLVPRHRCGILYRSRRNSSSAPKARLLPYPDTADGAEHGSDGWLAGGSILLSPKPVRAKAEYVTARCKAQSAARDAQLVVGAYFCRRANDSARRST